MATIRILVISFSVALAACATGNFDDPREDSGRTTSRGDSGRGGGDTATDAVGRDLGGGDTDEDVDDTGLSDTLSDTEPGDTGTGDLRPEEDVTVPWGDVPDGVSASVRAAIEASRAGLLEFCDCCNSRFDSDPALCLSSFDDGGFEPTQCELDGLGRAGADADGYLGCLVGAYSELANCIDSCGGGCSLCENTFNFAANRCEGDYPTVVSQFDACP